MKRTIEPEWLDALAADDPKALGSRRDLRRLNRIMGHADILRHLLKSGAVPRNPKRLVELGAGDGTLMLQLAKHFSRDWPRIEVVLVDCSNVMTEETRECFKSLGWSVENVKADALDWLSQPANPLADVMFANLFLHQFTDAQLSKMLGLAAEQTKLFAACEPRRAALPLALSRLLGFIGCNEVTRHDAPLSVLAGFAGKELSTLWSARENWRLREQKARLLSHAFLAERIAAPRP